MWRGGENCSMGVHSDREGRQVRWRQLFLTGAVVLPVGCASVGPQTILTESKQRETPVAILKFTAQNATPVSAPILMASAVSHQVDLSRVSPVAATAVSGIPGAVFTDAVSSTAPSSSESEPGLLADNVATTISSAAGQEVVAADGSRYVLTPINFVRRLFQHLRQRRLIQSARLVHLSKLATRSSSILRNWTCRQLCNWWLARTLKSRSLISESPKPPHVLTRLKLCGCRQFAQGSVLNRHEGTLQEFKRSDCRRQPKLTPGRLRRSGGGCGDESDAWSIG